MANLGNSSAPGSGVVWNDFGSGYQYWSGPFTMPSPGGTISDLYIYAGGDASSWNGNLCIWGSTALLWASAAVNFPNSPRTGGGQQWLHASVPSLWVPGGTTINLGLWAGGDLVWTKESGGTTWRSSSSVGGSPTSLPGGPVNAATALGAYVTYTPLPAPTLSSASPSVAPAGATTTLTGTNLLHATGITVCGVAATTYTINSDTSITVTVPAGATGTGTIVVTTPAGSASIAFTAGQVYVGIGGSVASIKAIYYGTGSGVATVAGVWVPDGAGGVKRVW